MRESHARTCPEIQPRKYSDTQVSNTQFSTPLRDQLWI